MLNAGQVTTDSAGPSALDDFQFRYSPSGAEDGPLLRTAPLPGELSAELVEGTLSEALGPEAWWTEGVPEPIRKGAEKRRLEDLKARWHGPRGESVILYVDFPQYADIMIEQWEHFEDLIGDQAWLVNYFAEMNRTRRALRTPGH